jgi:hypothetical protein
MTIVKTPCTENDEYPVNNIFVNKHRKSIVKLEMFSKLAKKDSQAGKAFSEYINVGVREEKGDPQDSKSNLRELSKKELILYTDGDTCSITIPLQSNKTFALGGHSIFPPAFGQCISEFISFPFTCQAIPSPATHSLLKKGLELAIFRGIPIHESESQSVLSLITDRVATYYSPRLNHPITDFDIVLHKRSNLGHTHSNQLKKSVQHVYYISVYIRPGSSPLHTLKALFGLRRGPNPISCHWIGEVWEDYASLRVMSPSTILLDRTPVTSLAGFETPGVDIAVLVTALIQDNQTFPLHEVAYFWVEKTDPGTCAVNIV